jgi:hypothetical protein
MHIHPLIQRQAHTTQSNGGHHKGSVCIVRHSFYPSELSVKREAEALRYDGSDERCTGCGRLVRRSLRK